MHKLRIRFAISVAHPGQCFGILAVGADAGSVSSVSLSCLHRRELAGSQVRANRRGDG